MIPAALAARAENGETPLMAALYRGHADAVALLLDSGAPLDLFAAAATGRLEPLDQRARAGKSVGSTITPTTAGRRSTSRRSSAATTPLNGCSMPAPIQAHCRSNSLRNTPLHAALAGRHTDVALLLVARGADVNRPTPGAIRRSTSPQRTG